MIHSMCGGTTCEVKHYDFAKVEIENEGIFWYVSTICDLKEGDRVRVPYGRLETLVEAKVLRIDKNVSSQTSPISLKRARYIHSKI